MTGVKFRVGDRVRCIEWSGRFLRAGDEYVIREVSDRGYRVIAVTPHEGFYGRGTYPLDGTFELVGQANINSILDTAKKLIDGSRADEYGSFSDNAVQQADLWNAYLTDHNGGIRTITPMDVPAMMILVKLMRLSGNTTHQDSWVDVAGFAGLSDQVYHGAVEQVEVIEEHDTADDTVQLPDSPFKNGDRVRVTDGPIHIKPEGADDDMKSEDRPALIADRSNLVYA